MPSRLIARASTLAVVVLVTGACASGATGSMVPATSAAPASGSGQPPGSAQTSPEPSHAGDGIGHSIGPSDIVLRAETRGGFIGLETVMSRVPEFTLYGDGRALLLPAEANEVAGGGLNPGAAGGDAVAIPTLREARLSEDEVQALLRFALVDGRLGTARDAYMGGNMDAPSTVFELHADGADRTVLVTGLTNDPAPGPDAASIRAFAALVDRLRSIATGADYASAGVVAVLAETEAPAGQPVEPWPFSDLAPAAFPQPADDAAIPFPRRLLTADEIVEAEAAVGEGPALVHVAGPDGRTYALLLRPALPEELAGG
jgi:hypothetical protein